MRVRLVLPTGTRAAARRTDKDGRRACARGFLQIRGVDAPAAGRGLPEVWAWLGLTNVLVMLVARRIGGVKLRRPPTWSRPACRGPNWQIGTMAGRTFSGECRKNLPSERETSALCSGQLHDHPVEHRPCVCAGSRPIAEYLYLAC